MPVTPVTAHLRNRAYSDVHWAHGTRFSWNSTVRTEPSQRGQSPTAPFVPRGLILLAEAQEICGGSHHDVLALSRRQQTRYILQVRSTGIRSPASLEAIFRIAMVSDG